MTKNKTNINAAFIGIDQWRKLEYKTFSYISNSKIFMEKYPLFAQKVKNYLYQLDPFRKATSDIKKKKQKKKTKKGNDSIKSSLEFEANLTVSYEKSDLKLFIGILERNENDEFKGISYYLAIGKAGNPGEKDNPIRKFHFDYVTKDNCTDMPHPVFHLQYGGSLSNELETHFLLDTYNKKIDKWLESPRIFFPPLSFALLLTMIFREFPDGDTAKVIEDSEWRKLVNENEIILLKPYYKNCYDCLNDDKRSNSLIHYYHYW